MIDLMVRTHSFSLHMSRLTVTVLLAAMLMIVPFGSALAQSSPDLGRAGSFAALAGTEVACTDSVVTGDLGVDLGGTISNCQTSGTIHEGDLAAQQAYDDFLLAYDSLTPVPCDVILSGTLAGVTLPPGVYCFSGAAALTGLLTLDGPANGVWIFKIGTNGTGALATTNFTVAMPAGGICQNKVFWWTAQDATITDSQFIGTILAGTDITFTRGSLNGRALAKNAVTMTGPAGSIGFCQATPTLASGAIVLVLLTFSVLFLCSRSRWGKCWK